MSLSSKVVSLEVQQHCSWLYQKADRQTPSFKSVIQSTARSMTPAKVPGRSSKSHSEEVSCDEAGEHRARGPTREARSRAGLAGGEGDHAADGARERSPEHSRCDQGHAQPQQETEAEDSGAWVAEIRQERQTFRA